MVFLESGMAAGEDNNNRRLACAYDNSTRDNKEKSLHRQAKTDSTGTQKKTLAYRVSRINDSKNTPDA